MKKISKKFHYESDHTHRYKSQTRYKFKSTDGVTGPARQATREAGRRSSVRHGRSRRWSTTGDDVGVQWAGGEVPGTTRAPGWRRGLSVAVFGAAG
jgi:hypothetical protein